MDLPGRGAATERRRRQRGSRAGRGGAAGGRRGRALARRPSRAPLAHNPPSHLLARRRGCDACGQAGVRQQPGVEDQLAGRSAGRRGRAPAQRSAAGQGVAWHGRIASRSAGAAAAGSGPWAPNPAALGAQPGWNVDSPFALPCASQRAGPSSSSRQAAPGLLQAALLLLLLYTHSHQAPPPPLFPTSPPPLNPHHRLAPAAACRRT